MAKSVVGLIVLHTAACLAVTGALIVQWEAHRVTWLPDWSTLALCCVAVFPAGPLLGFLVAVLGPNTPSKPDALAVQARRRIGRLVKTAVLAFFLVALLIPILPPPGDVAAGLVLLGGAGLTTLLAPWVALYSTWFRL